MNQLTHPSCSRVARTASLFNHTLCLLCMQVRWPFFYDVLLDINQIPQLVRELQLRPWPMLQLLSFTAKPTSSHGGSSSSNIQAWSAEVPAGAFVKDHQNDRWRTLIYLQSSRVFCQPLFCRTSVTPFKTFQFLPGYLPIFVPVYSHVRFLGVDCHRPRPACRRNGELCFWSSWKRD